MRPNGKRLLVLGCTNNAPDIDSYAKKNGVNIVVAGLGFGDDIGAVAKEKYLIDALDRDALADLIVEKNIDGVFVGGNEDLISSVIDVTERLKMPFYSSRELWDRLMNKRMFKEACRKYGVPTMEDHEIDENDLDKEALRLSYPVVIKPVDNCGCVGVSKCDRAEDFKKDYLFAKENSHIGQVTVEEFCDGFEICVYYTFVDGVATLSAMSDKYVRGNANSFIPLAEVYAYPSRYIGIYKEQIDEKMKRMLTDLGVKNGITSMQGFVSDGKFKFFEMGYRLGGTAQYRYTEAINGINSLHMMMDHALTGHMTPGVQHRDNADFDRICCTLTLLSKGGKVARIEGLEEARALPEVLYIENRYKVGEVIPASHTVSQFHIRRFIVADTEARMKELINLLQNSIKAYDDNGESMLITRFDTDRLEF